MAACKSPNNVVLDLYNAQMHKNIQHMLQSSFPHLTTSSAAQATMPKCSVNVLFLAPVMSLYKFSILLFICSNYTASSTLLPTDPDYIYEMEKGISKFLYDYEKHHPEKLAVVEKYAVQFEKRSQECTDNDINQDPVHTFLKVKTLVKEWEKILKYITPNHEIVVEESAQVPNDQDVHEAAMAIFRVQDFYSMSTDDMIAFGKDRITAAHCFDIGLAAFEMSDYYHALIWFLEAEKRLAIEKEPSLKEIDLLPPLILALHEQHMTHRSHINLFRLMQLFTTTSPDKRDEIFEKFPKIKELQQSNNIDLAYESLCSNSRHEGQASINPNTKCYYKKTSPFLALAAVKSEILSNDPIIILYHDVISDDEIEILLSLVKGKLERAATEDKKVNKVRTSSIAWLTVDDHPMIDNLEKRVGSITGLDMVLAEQLQVNRYVPGGHYASHFDNFYPFRDTPEEFGTDRIATFMYYLSDSRGGGATVFPVLNLSIFPSKNDALFWYTLDKSGNRIHATLHGGCPLVSGVKWVANQWMHETGNEFLRRCGLRENE